MDAERSTKKGCISKAIGRGMASICNWQPASHHMAGPKQVLNGGIIATIIDCHCVCTAIAAAYREESREIGSDPKLLYVTGALNLKYLRPTPIKDEVLLRAQLRAVDEKKTTLTCSLFANQKETVQAEVVAMKVPADWSNRIEF